MSWEHQNFPKFSAMRRVPNFQFLLKTEPTDPVFCQFSLFFSILLIKYCKNDEKHVQLLSRDQNNYTEIVITFIFHVNMIEMLATDPVF